jgi:hypothetical protein
VGDTASQAILRFEGMRNLLSRGPVFLLPLGQLLSTPVRLAYSALCRNLQTGAFLLDFCQLELASVNIPHRIRASGLPPRAFVVTSQDRGTAQEGLGSLTIASDQVTIPTADGREPIL